MLLVKNTVLLVIDIQGKLANSMYEKEALFDNLQRLIKGVRILGVPIIITEQNPQGLGPTIQELAPLITGINPVPKLAFNCCQEQRFNDEFNKINRKQVLIAGIETHICVYQTAVDLIQRGYEVQVIADACSSRTLRNREIGIQRMLSEGAVISSTEMALFELLQVAEGAKFKEILKVVK